MHENGRGQDPEMRETQPYKRKATHATRLGRLARIAGMPLALVIAIMLFLPCTLHAQVQNGSISGTVTDSQGAVIPGATVTLTQPATGLVLHGHSNQVGLYSFPQLLPGNYTVQVEKKGFEKTVSSLTLTVGQAAELDIHLSIGSESQTVTIEADNSAALDTQTSNLDYTVQSKQMDQLPLNGRNPYGLAALAPGILPGGDFGVGIAVTRGAVVSAATNNFESNGGIGGSNGILLDGVDITVCCQGQPAVVPSVEVVNQFKVVTSVPPAEYGRESGGVINVATKSGDNHLHGDVYDFLRNDKLDAANFFTKRSGIYPYPGHADYRAPHRENQFGAFASGPVVLPRLYDGKDKMFFMFGYEGVRNLSPAVGLTTVPTALMRQGIFTEAPTVVYDPNSYNATTGTRTPIAAASCNNTAYPSGYCIPSSEFNPVANALLPLLPAPNLPGITNNYSYVQNQTDADNQFNFRIDYNFSAKQRSFIRGTRDIDSHFVNDLFNKANGLSGWYQNLSGYLFAAGHIWQMSPTTLLQITYGFARLDNAQIYNPFFKYDAAQYGFSSNFASEEQIVGLPYITVSGEQAFGSQAAWGNSAHQAHTLNANALLQRGKHTINIGYNGKLVLENELGLTNCCGSFSFNTKFTGGPSPNASLPAGQSPFDAWASFLLGYPASGSLTRQTTPALNQWVTSFYVQDDWRLVPRLTLNMGVRWDVETAFGERHNHWADFDPLLTNPISSSAGINVRGGVQFLGYDGSPTRTSQTVYSEVGPRLGFSYALTPQTVLRGGYGILYIPLSERGYNGASNIGFTQTTNIPSSASGFTPAVTIDNPLPSGVLLPAGASAGTGVEDGTSLDGFTYHDPVPYQQQWNVGVERALTTGLTLNVNYVGGHGVHLPMNLRPNDLQPQYFGTPGESAQVTYLQQQVPNPFYGATGLAPGSILANPTVQRVQLLSAFPQYTSGAISAISNGSVGEGDEDIGSTTYNALQATLEVRHKSGIYGSASYVWSKLLGNVTDLTTGFLNSTGNPNFQDQYFLHQYEHSTLATDIRHRVVGTVNYPIPVGKGKKFGSTIPTWADEIVGGWNLTTIIDVYSGFPLGMGVSGAPAFAGGRPMYVPGVKALTSGSTHHRLGGAGQSQTYLNPAAFALTESFQLGDVPRSAAALRGPLSFDDNASVIKYFPIREDLALEFRAEAFNVLNKVDFGLPNGTVGASNFGDITSQANLPRNVQLAMRIHF